MKRTWITFTDHFEPGPMTPWVHRAVDAPIWVDAKVHEPPLPEPVPGEGYARYHIEIDGVTFEFVSKVEIQRCVEVLSERHLPSTLALCRGTGMGPNRHWLSRLPSRAKSWRYRERAVKELRRFLQSLDQG